MTRWLLNYRDSVGKVRSRAAMFVPVSEPEPESESEPEFEPDLSEYEDTGQSLDSASLAVARISNVCINTWNRWVTKGMSQP
jgi:hypothetical protein